MRVKGVRMKWGEKSIIDGVIESTNLPLFFVCSFSFLFSFFLIFLIFQNS